MKLFARARICAFAIIAILPSSAFAQDSIRMMEHTGPAASPGSSGSTGGMDETVGGVGIGTGGGGPSIADVHGTNQGLPTRAEAGTVSDSTTNSGMTVAPNSAGAVATHLGIAGTGARGADPASASSP